CARALLALLRPLDPPLGGRRLINKPKSPPAMADDPAVARRLGCLLWAHHAPDRGTRAGRPGAAQTPDPGGRPLWNGGGCEAATPIAAPHRPDRRPRLEDDPGDRRDRRRSGRRFGGGLGR